MAGYVESQFGELYTEGEDVIVKSKTGDRFIATTKEDAENLLAAGEMVLATAEDVARHDTRKRAESASGVVKTAAESGAAGFFDAALAIPKLATATADLAGIAEDPLADVSGRGTVAAARGLAAEAAGGEMSLAERQYAEEARARAQINPGTSMAAYGAGSIAGSGLTLGVGGQVARGAQGLGRFGQAAAQFAAEGAIEGAAATSEQAFIDDHELTAEQMWAGAGIGAAFGIGLAGAGALARAGGGKLRKVFGRGDEVPVSQLSDETLESTIARTVGDDPAPGVVAKLRELVESGQKIASGADDDAAQAISTSGALRWDKPARDARDMVRNRTKIVDEASIDIAERLDTISENVEDVLEDAVDGAARKERLRELVRGGDEAVQVAAARRHMDEAIKLADEIDPPAPTRLAGEKSSAFSARKKEADKIANRAYGNKAARREIADYIRNLRGQLDSASDAGEAYWIVDEAKRAMQKPVKEIRKRVGKAKDQGSAVKMRKLADRIEKTQVPIKDGLMDEEIWKAAGTWQRKKNAAFNRFLASSREFQANLTRQVEGVQYETGRGLYRADPGKVRSFLGKLGTADGVLPERYVREHIAETKKLTDAIAEGGSMEKFDAPLKSIQDSYKSVDEALDSAQKTIKVANQIDALTKAEKGGPFGSVVGGAALGGMIGGLPGAMLGAGVSVLTRPGQLAHQAGAIQEMARQVNARTNGALGRLFKKGKGPAIKVRGVRKPKTTTLPTGLTGKTQVPRAAAVRFALPGKDSQQSYQQRAEEIQTVIASRGQQIMDYSGRELGGMAAQTPRTHIAMAGKAMAAAQYLHSKLPEMTSDPELKRLGVVPPPDQLDKFRVAWEAVMDPLSVIEQLEDGFIHPDAVEALQTVYPRLWDSLKTQTIQHLMTLPEPPSLQVRTQLDLLFDMDGAIEPTLSPERLGRNAELNQLRLEQLEPQSPPSPGRSQPDIAANYETAAQRISS